MTIRITATARLTADPIMRFTKAGKAVASLRVVSNERRYSNETGQWEDGDSTFIDVSVFGAKAEAVGEQLRKGQLVLIEGKLKSREYEKDGQKVTAYQINAEEVAALVVPQSSGRSAPRPAQQQGDPWAGGGRQQPAGDPWQQESAPF